MKIIFLDIDGVMNYLGGKSVTPEDMYFLEDDKLVLLKQIVEETGAYLVLTSTWRYGWREADFGNTRSIFAQNFFKLRDKFHKYGLVFFSKTPILKGFSREMEIQYWLSTWEGEKVESYVIFDDEEYQFSKQTECFIQTHKDKGLLPEHVEQAIEILGKKKIE